MIELYDVNAEMATLGSMILSEKVAKDLSRSLAPAQFWHPAHRLIFLACQHLVDTRQPVDLVTLCSRLRATGDLDRVGGEDYVIAVGESTPGASNGPYHADIVRDKARIRALHAAGRRMMELAVSPDSTDAKIAEAQAEISSLVRSGDRRTVHRIQDLVRDYVSGLDTVLETGEVERGIMTGIQGLDHATLGLSRGQMMVIAARPSMGKSALGTQIALNVALSGRRVWVSSLEMSAQSTARRMVTQLSGISARALSKLALTTPAAEWNDSPYSVNTYTKLVGGADQLYALPIDIDDDGAATPEKLFSRISDANASGPMVELVIVDYLQCMESSRRSENRNVEIGAISRGIVNLGKELGVPVIALAQLNRSVEAKADKRPGLHDLRDSGTIEQDADLVAFLVRQHYYDVREGKAADTMEPTPAELFVAKNRDGALPNIRFAWDPRRLWFEEVA